MSPDEEGTLKLTPAEVLQLEAALDATPSPAGVTRNRYLGKVPFDPDCERCGRSGAVWNGRQLVRCPQCGEEDMTADDPRGERARDAHAMATANDSISRGYRDARDALVRELRAEDPGKWTLSALAAEVGCSKELIAYILKTEDRDGGTGDEVPVHRGE